eukprot:2731621-Pleurochrysis_carterae.AAC.1
MSEREGSMVGWDCVIDWLNGAITQGVTHHVSEERTIEVVEMCPLLEANCRALHEWVIGDARAEVA